jgi:hypothetical protein
VVAPGDEARAQRGRGAEQVQQHEGVAAEVADQREVVVAAQARQRPVVVDARDRLHAPPVAVAQAHAVDALGAPDVGAAVAAQRDGLVGGQHARHARHPQHLAAGLLLGQHAVHELVHFLQLVQAGLHRAVGAGDQLELRFAVVGGDAAVREGRAQRRRMGGERKPSRGQDAQALLLDAAAHAREPVGGQSGEALLQCAHAGSVLGVGAELSMPRCRLPDAMSSARGTPGNCPPPAPRRRLVY